MPELRELHLELALGAAGTLREDVEYQACSVQDPLARELLEVALLAGRQGMIDENEVRARFPRPVPDLLRLAAADEVAWVRGPSGPRDASNGNGAGRDGQRLEFLEFFLAGGSADSKADQYGPLAYLRAFEQ